MKRTGLALLMMVASTAYGAMAACSSSSGSNNPANGDAGGDGTAGGGNYQIEVGCTDAVDAVYADPGPLPAEKGAILKCAKYKDIGKADLEAAARAADPGADGGASTPGYSGKAFTSGAHVYRVLYRTERGDTANTPGYSSALVYLPDTPRAAQSPVVVASHGSRGQASKCAPSREDHAGDYVKSDFVHQVYPLVGLGFAVIAPDLAGYANYGAANNPPSAYASAADVGKSTLDGARALRKLISKSVNDKVVIVGHSQGGGTALSALALSDSYGSGGTVAAVALYAPLWWPQRAWAAILYAPQNYPIGKSAGGPVSTWYHYTHGELLDGPGHGLDVFAADKRAGVKAFIDGDCWAEDYASLEALGGAADGGVTKPTDFFDPAYATAIKAAAAGLNGGDCGGDALCDKWMARFRADRPHLTGNAAQVPIQVIYGDHDDTVTSDLAACVWDRLNQDQAAYKVCVVPGAGHGSAVAQKADYVSDWIASKTLGEAAPAPCALDQSALKDDAGALIGCTTFLSGGD